MIHQEKDHIHYSPIHKAFHLLFSAAMSQKTSGKNYNRTPCFNPATGKLAFSCKQDGASSADIYTMFDSKGKALSQITESTDAYEEYSSFNKEGNLLVYDKVQRSYYAKANFATFFGFGYSTIVVENSEISLSVSSSLIIVSI